MKRVHTFSILAFVLLFGTFAVFGGCNPEQETETIRIGLLVPLTGGAASYGQNSRQGAKLALEKFKAENPNILVEMVVQDSQGEPATGNRAASQLINLNNVVAVIGDVTSGVTMAVAPTMNTQQVPVISPGASSPNISTAGEYVFRTWPSDKFEAERMAEHISRQGIENLAVLYINNEYGAAMENALRSKLASEGAPTSIVASESFEQGAREMRAQLRRIKQSNADALYFVGFPEAAVVFGRGYSNEGIDIPVFATSAFQDPQIPEKTDGVLNGTVYTKPAGDTPITESFTKAFQKAHGQEPGLTSDTAYDAMSLILDATLAIRKEGKEVTGKAIKNYLLQVKNYEGASGRLSFDQQGDVRVPINLFVLRDGQYQELEPQKSQPAS